MVGIGEHDLRPHLRYPLSRDSFDRRSRTDRHKDRRLNRSVWSFESTGTSIAVSCRNLKMKIHLRSFIF